MCTATIHRSRSQLRRTALDKYPKQDLVAMATENLEPEEGVALLKPKEGAFSSSPSIRKKGDSFRRGGVFPLHGWATRGVGRVRGGGGGVYPALSVSNSTLANSAL